MLSVEANYSTNYLVASGCDIIVLCLLLDLVVGFGGMIICKLGHESNN